MFKKFAAAALGAFIVIMSSNAMAENNNYEKAAFNAWFDSLPEFDSQFWRRRLWRYFRSGDVDALDDAADLSGRLVGAAVTLGAFQADDAYLQILNDEFNYVTPENIAKWGELQPDNPNEWDFTRVDELLDSSEANEQLFKGHALVWHIQLPSFINNDLTPSELKSLMDNHITAVLNRYAGRVYAWDVVNEAIVDDGSYRDSIFFQKFGDQYIADAFHTANAIDPYAKLYYNDFGIERINTKSTAVYEMVKGLVEDGVPIDGVGFQMHLSGEFPPSVEQIVENFERFTALGLTVNISELDVRLAKLPWEKTSNLAIQQQIYHRVVDACMRVANCEAVTTWGLTDRYSWIDSTFGPDDPLQYDEQFNRKPAYYGMLDGFVGLDADPLGMMPNLIPNNSFEAGDDGWFAFGDGQIETVRSRTIRGKRRLTGKRILQSTGRTDTFNGPAYNILGLVGQNQTYDASALVSIRGNRRADVRISAQLQCEGEDAQFVTVADGRARYRRWKRLAGEFTTPDCVLEVANLYVEGPEAGVRVYIDDISLRPRELILAANEDLGPNVITNSGFEDGIDGWIGYEGATVQVSTNTPFAGAQAMYATDRTAVFDGPAYSLLGQVEAGKEYQLTSRIRIEGSPSEQVKATIRAVCPSGTQFLGIAGSQASDSSWSLLTGTVLIPDCGATDLTLYFEGPDPAINILLDEVFFQQVLTEPSDDLISNGDFETNADGWFGFGGAAISATTDEAFTGDQSLVATNRTENFEGPAINLTNLVTPGATYDFMGYTRIRGLAASAGVNATLLVQCSDVPGDQYLGIAGVQASDTDWSQLVGSVTVPDCALTTVFLYIEGPDAGIDILVDTLSLVLADGGNPPSGNLVANSGFEENSTGWFGFGSALLSTTTDQAFAGSQSLLATNRTANFEGPATDLVGLVEPGMEYNVSAQVRIGNSPAAQVSATIQTVCTDSSEEFNGTGEVTASDTAWTEVSGSITLPSCEATAQRLYFQGPGAGVDIYIDEVSVELANPVPPTGNLVSNPDFESGTDPWFGFGGAILSATSAQAFGGTQSLLATNRTANFEGPAIDLAGLVLPSTQYTVTAQVRLGNAMSAPVSATIQTVCSDSSEEFNGTAEVTATDSGWVEVNGNITLPACEATAQRLYFQGPGSGIDIYLDDVSVEVTPVTPPTENLVQNSDFETGTDFWFEFGDGAIATTMTEAFTGSQSLISTGRTANFNGPAVDLASVLTPGTQYAVTVQTRIAGAATADVSATIQTVCDDSSEMFNGTAPVTASDSAWTELAGNITLPACTATAQRLYFQGPDGGIDVLIDAVSVTAVN